jgi:phage head maturation protease
MKSTTTVKALGGNRVGGYAVLWGDATKRDLTKEFFTPETEDLETLFKAMGKLPLLYQHAGDGALKTAVVGPVDVLTKDEIGLWYEAQLSMAAQYQDAIHGLIEQGALGTSSGTLPAARRVDRKTGRIQRWAIAELSLTPTPAEPRMMERPVAEVAAAFKAVGLVLDGLDEADVADGLDVADGAGGGEKVISAPATGHGDMKSGEGAADAASGPEDGQPADDELTLIKNILIETERLALLKLAGGQRR